MWPGGWVEIKTKVWNGLKAICCLGKTMIHWVCFMDLALYPVVPVLTWCDMSMGVWYLGPTCRGFLDTASTLNMDLGLFWQRWCIDFTLYAWFQIYQYQMNLHIHIVVGESSLRALSCVHGSFLSSFAFYIDIEAKKERSCFSVFVLIPIRFI